jgi:hypothetical protein
MIEFIDRELLFENETIEIVFPGKTISRQIFVEDKLRTIFDLLCLFKFI